MKLRKSGAGGTNMPETARPLLDHMVYEIIPMKSIDAAIEVLPPASKVSVTCSPVLGIPATQEHTERVMSLGHTAIPHFAARLVNGPEEASALADWTRSQGIESVFIIAGDAEEAAHYEGAAPFIRDFIAGEPGVSRIGVSSYPDGHPLIDNETIEAALLEKQQILAEAGIEGWASTQMCFDVDLIRSWLTHQRASGVTLPIHLGIPGVIDRVRLMKMGTRLGIGASLRYLKKNKSTMASLLGPGGYDPTEMLAALAPDAEALGIEALHCFTFNSVADTAKWHDACLAATS